MAPSTSVLPFPQPSTFACPAPQSQAPRLAAMFASKWTRVMSFDAAVASPRRNSASSAQAALWRDMIFITAPASVAAQQY